MSGISEYSHNKFNTCEGCPDHSVEPNCQATCQGYLFRNEKYDKISTEKHNDQETNPMKLM